CTTMKVW
nr:immunoglobulin heavy chain junction region [Macaca mulatta]MOV43303.1 immunoglobulin heavy chain junction region [Macaca mulatta]MOV46703.1 immunoglobulin heavy chain junction region [Macaca mulatta]MOV47328.1 immunoglobulin heavy chain junction region [Macaca mulatta]MOX93991.1 immunoglobulin heavy chain junction region [Macaca mulatta]